MNVTERSKVADDLLVEMARLGAGSPEDKVAVAGMLAGKVVASVVSDARDRSSAVTALQSAMSAQLTWETAGEHRARQPIGRMGMEDDE